MFLYTFRNKGRLKEINCPEPLWCGHALKNFRLSQGKHILQYLIFVRPCVRIEKFITINCNSLHFFNSATGFFAILIVKARHFGTREDVF